MSMEDVLRQNEGDLAEVYASNLETVRNMQRTLRQDILPGLVHELHLDDEEERRAISWLDDLQSIFRLLRRHKFTLPFALEDARDVLLWRLAVIPTEILRLATPFIQCLPMDVRDPFGRPVVVMKLCEMLGSLHDVRPELIHYMELLRLHLHALNIEQESLGGERPILQYIALVDIGSMPLQGVQGIELVSWIIYELVPRFPGMLAAALVLNYSWAHSGVWNVVKRLLPKSALTRVFFPSREELVGLLSADAVPHDYGGRLRPLSELEDPLENLGGDTHQGRRHGSGSGSGSTAASAPGASHSPVHVDHNNDNNSGRPLSSSPAPLSRVPSISPYSHLNPYFGYPVARQDANALTPRLRHGRRRKRDLVRTLAALWWGKWKKHLWLLLCAAVCAMTYRSRRRGRARLGSGRGLGPGAVVVRTRT